MLLSYKSQTFLYICWIFVLDIQHIAEKQRPGWGSSAIHFSFRKYVSGQKYVA